MDVQLLLKGVLLLVLGLAAAYYLGFAPSKGKVSTSSIAAPVLPHL